MYHTTYLIHYNKNHSKANGQFVSGDGDGDGIVNDHANQRKSQSRSSDYNRLNSAIEETKKRKKTGTVLGLVGAGVMSAGVLSAVLGDAFDNEGAGIAGIAATVAGAGVSTVGASLWAKENRRLKKEVDRVIDEHYDAPLSKAFAELQRGS